jgi:hypothetical protein
MFASLLLVAASTLFLVTHRSKEDTLEARDESDTEAAAKPDAVLFALWSASISLAVVLLSMSGIALLKHLPHLVGS